MKLVIGLLFALCLVGVRADVVETEETAPEREEAVVHMTDHTPLALQKAEAKEAAEAAAEEAEEEVSDAPMRFADSESESESEDYPNAYPLPDGSVVDHDTDEVANDPTYLLSAIIGCPTESFNHKRFRGNRSIRKQLKHRLKRNVLPQPKRQN